MGNIKIAHSHQERQIEKKQGDKSINLDIKIKMERKENIKK